jgi:glycyl-tRNA synthetase
MAEIEHFCDPNFKDHPKFVDVQDIKLMLYSACNQMDGKSAVLTSIGDAVKTVGINNANFRLNVKLYFISGFGGQ